VTLAKAVEKIVARHGRRHPATQVFQALRMEVNDELGALREGLVALTSRLEPGSRIAVITFHSLEDRIVKKFFRERSREWLDRRNGRSRGRIRNSSSGSSTISRSNQTRSNNAPIRVRAAQSCAWRKKS